MARARSTSTDEIISIAAELFLERGYHNTSIDDIALAANITKPTVYQYVKGKQWLLDQIMLRVIDETSAALVPWDENAESLDDQLDSYIRLHIQRATERRVFFRILLSEESEMSELVRRRWRSYGREITENFAQLLELYRRRGLLAVDTDLVALANLIVSMLASLNRWYDAEGPIEPDEIAAVIRQLISGAIERDTSGS